MSDGSDAGEASMGESLDAFDDDLSPLGAVDRRIVHRDGLWHQVFHCLVVRTQHPARVLLQRRSAAARSFAGLLDLSATGHLVAGEQPEDGVRELEEEIGVVASASELIALGQRPMVDDAGEGRNREIIHAYLLPLDRPLETFDLTDRDVAGLVEIEVADLLRILRDPSAVVACREADAHGHIVESACHQRDLVPDVDGYWVAMALAAERFVDGTGPLAV